MKKLLLPFLLLSAMALLRLLFPRRRQSNDLSVPVLHNRSISDLCPSVACPLGVRAALRTTTRPS